MSDKTHYSVATLGFAERERRVFSSVLVISEYRSPAFRTYTSQRGVFPDLVIINSDHPTATATWQKYQAAHAHIAKIVPIFLSRTTAVPTGSYALRRPILATRLFALLEQVVTEVHGFRPPLAIAQDDPLFVLTPGDTQKLKIADAPAGDAGTPGNAALAAVPPLEKEAAVRAAVPPAQPAAASRASGAADIIALVVDDSLPVRIQMRTALASIAQHVDFAESGEAALDLIDRRRYSVIFLDVILPGKDGYEVCKRIKRHPLQKGTPVVMLTGSSSPADRVKGKLAGCDTYLIKPVKQAVFEQVVSEFVRASAAA